MRARVTDYLLYRWRYYLGYSFLSIAVVAACVAAFFTPEALRAGEITSSLASGSLSMESMNADMIVNLPYHILQRFSFIVFGVTTFSIKLPSLIIGALTIVGVFMLIRTWFRRNVAIIITLITSTTTQFLFLVQDGTPKIMYVFVAVWLLVCGTAVTRNMIFSTFWKVLAGALIAAALYMPLGIYLVAAVFTTAFFHPHIRHVMKHLPRLKLTLAIVFGLASLAPLGYAVVIDPKIIATLAGIPTGSVDWLTNAKTLFFDFFGFSMAPTGYMPRPLYSLGVTLIMALGVYRLLNQRYTARSYIVLILCVVMLPLMILNPDLASNFYAVAIILIAYGVDSLIVNWYKLFPRNPYARVGGFIPLGILVTGIVFSGVVRYINSYTYSPDILRHYSTDLRLLDKTIKPLGNQKDPTTILVDGDELAFYRLIARYDRRMTVTATPAALSSPFIATRDGRRTILPGSAAIDSIVTNGRRDNSDRLYVYKPVTK